jgi:aminoglycoside-2''-adenylyltransferase
VTFILAPDGPWQPARPLEAAAIFSAMTCPWWIAGGYAIELAVGGPVREHDDIDVLVLRRDQLHVQQALSGWEWWAADPPGTLRP